MYNSRIMTDELIEFTWQRPAAGFHWVNTETMLDSQRGRFLVPVNDLTQPKRIIPYSPLDGRVCLFRELAQVEPTEAGITAFANDYGALGGEISLLKGAVHGEHLPSWSIEINEMKCLVVL